MSRVLLEARKERILLSEWKSKSLYSALFDPQLALCQGHRYLYLLVNEHRVSTREPRFFLSLSLSRRIRRASSSSFPFDANVFVTDSQQFNDLRSMASEIVTLHPLKLPKCLSKKQLASLFGPIFPSHVDTLTRVGVETRAICLSMHASIERRSKEDRKSVV